MRVGGRYRDSEKEGGKRNREENLFQKEVKYKKSVVERLK